MRSSKRRGRASGATGARHSARGRGGRALGPPRRPPARCAPRAPERRRSSASHARRDRRRMKPTSGARQRTRDVRDPCNGEVEQGSGRGSHGRGGVVGADRRSRVTSQLGAGRFRGASRGTEVLRIRDAVEDDDERVFGVVAIGELALRDAGTAKSRAMTPSAHRRRIGEAHWDSAASAARHDVAGGPPMRRVRRSLRARPARSPRERSASRRRTAMPSVVDAAVPARASAWVCAS
jgi:hypothetical protein